ncbi:MAG: Ig-like domain-containing protein [Bacteroidales bacterium]|nr:Ig-like domain-containing protein [Bacteroidales bacterium]
MMRILLKRIPLLLFVGIIYSCEKPSQPQPKPEEKPAISIPTQSQAVFSNGISFTPPSPQTANQPQTQTVSFTATESWSASVTDTKASTWLTVVPSSGGAGTVNMTVTAQPNDTDKARKASVTIKCGSMNKTFTVEQAAKAAANVAVTEVILNKTKLTLKEGDSETLLATVKPDDATDKTVTWSTSDEAIAKVDDNGKVTAVKEGTATITAKAGEKSANCAVSVSKKVVDVTSVTLNKTELTLTEGDSESLTATVKPDDATDKTVTWTSSDASIASVDVNGKVTAVKDGSATITAKAGEKTATCAVTVSKNVVAVTSVTLNKTELTLTEGDSETLAATVKPDDATDRTVTWSTSDATVAAVDNNGKVTAVKEGSATITAMAGEESATCAVSISKKVIEVASVTLNKTELILTEGDSETLTATVKPDDATDKTVTWSTSDESIAKVDNNGKVTAVKEGTATIIARAGAKSATCALSVRRKVIEVTSITLNKAELTLTEGDSETLTATVKPDDATDKTVTWSTSDATIATVDNNGKVTAVKAGSATITAKAGEKSATCALSVSRKVIEVTSVTLNKAELTLTEGDSETLSATVKPDDATDKTVMWSSSDASVASVDANGKVTALKEGKATITAKAGEKSATCAVNVSRKVIEVTSVTMNKAELTLTEGDSETLTATVKPDDATDKTVTWTSSDANVASVDAYGKVTAVKEGHATITAKAGEITASCSVTVNKKVIPVTEVVLNKTQLKLTEGDSESLIATVKPDDATNKIVTWITSDQKIATVDNDGIVRAIAPGTAKITAKAEGKTASCEVIVSAKVPDGGSEGMGEEHWN